MGPCLVEADITCVAEDGTECAELIPPDVESEETCLVNVCYNVEIKNVGDVCMEVTVVDLNVNDQVASLLDSVTVNPLCPPDSTSVESCGDIDICAGGQFSANINVEADPPNGDRCQAQGEYIFTIVPIVPSPESSSVTPPVASPVTPPLSSPVTPPLSSPVTPPLSPPVTPPLSPPVTPPLSLPVTPPVSPPVTPDVPPPTCTIELSSDCTIAGGESDGQDCETPTVGITLCLERPTGVTMLFNGGGCEQSDNTQELQFSCADMNGGPPVNEGEQAYIVVTDIKGLGITYFSGLVAVGETYVLNDGGERFETDQFITIYTPDQSTVLQMVQYHCSCSSNLELKNRFGASQLVEFVNDLQGVVSCFQTISFAIDVALPVTATGSEEIELTSMTAMTSFAGDVDLTDQVAGQVIGPDNPSVVVTLEGTINAAERQTYTIAYDVQGTRVADGELCTGMDMISIVAGADPNAPGAAPTGTDGSPTGGSPTDGSPTGGSSTGGSSTSGPSTGGSATSAPSSPGGSPTSTSKTGGSPTSASKTGGSPTSTSKNGGSPSGGSPSSTSKTGGSPSGGSSTGGSPSSTSKTGGSPSGGSPSSTSKTGGSSTGGSATSEPSSPGGSPTSTSKNARRIRKL